VQDPQVVLGRPLRPLLEQGIVGHAEAAAGEQVRLVTIVSESPRLANQPVDDMPVVDAVLAPAPQPRQRCYLLLGVPDLDPLGVQPGLDPLADQPTGHRVDVALHTDGAARLHPHPQPLARLQAVSREWPQQGQFLGQTGLPTGVALGKQLPQEHHVGIAASEVPAATQHQGLVQASLELMVALLHVAVLIALASLDGLALQAVVLQQRLVALLERLPSEDPRLDGGRQPIRAVQGRHAAQFPQGVLQALAEALQALRKTDSSCLPIRVSEHEVIDQVREGAARDGDTQGGAVREIAGRQPARVMDLGEENLLGRPLLGPPLLDPSLQGPQLALGKAARLLPLQGLEERLGFQARVEGQLFQGPGPDLREGVGPGTPVAVHASDLCGQLVKAAILTGGLGVHARLGGCQLLEQPMLVEAKELTHLVIGDHREPPVLGLRMVYSCSRTGNSNCR
jgi:hypothetical protein